MSYERCRREASQSEVCDDSATKSDPSEDSLDDLDDEGFREALQGSVDEIEAAGSFAARYHTDVYPNPGLYINEYGSVGLPLSASDAEVIARFSQRAPFGRGDETVVDVSVRKTWELDTSRFKTRNPAWIKYVSGLKEKAVHALGVEGESSDIRAEPYKLLLYEQGAFFKAHRDTEKIPGMFGTLVICLPSKHQGGEVHVTHSGQKEVFDTSTTSEFDLSTLAWYSDVKHEIKPVTSGHRLVLTYNLVAKASGAPYQSARHLDERRSNIQRMLRKWREEFSHNDKYVSILEHQYTESRLCLATLKGQDRAKGEQLYDVCASNGVYLFLASMEHEEVEEDYGEGDEKTTTLDVVTTSGMRIADSLPIEDDEILSDDPFGGRDADSEDEGEYTGNESMPNTLRYRDTVMLLVLKENICQAFGFSLLTDSETTANLIEFLCQETQVRPDDPVIMGNAIKAMEKFLSRNPKNWDHGCYGYSSYRTSADSKVIPIILKWAMKFHNHALFSKAIQFSTASTQTTNRLNAGSISMIASNFRADSSQATPDWDSWVAPICSNIEKLSDFLYSIESFATGLGDDWLKASFRDWALKKLDERLESQATIDLGDENTWLDILKLYDDKWFCNRFVPLFSERVTREGIASFLNSLYKIRGTLPRISTVIAAFRVLRNKAPRLLRKPSNDERRHTQPFAYNRNASSTTPSNNLASEFFELVGTCLDNGCGEEVRHILTEAYKDFVELKSIEGVDWISAIKLVRPCEEKLREHPTLVPSQEVRDFMIGLLEGYIDSVVRTKPPVTMVWKFPPKGCGCKDCSMLDAFLTHPTQKVGRFSMAQKRRTHLEDRTYSSSLRRETDKSRSPYTLVLTKTDGEHLTQHSVWQMQYEDMRKELKEFQSDGFQTLLGDRYQDLIIGAPTDTHGSSGTTIAPASSRSAAPLSTSKNRQNQRGRGGGPRIAGTKRKAPAEVIDLCDD